jgi:hypothetical protein
MFIGKSVVARRLNSGQELLSRALEFIGLALLNLMMNISKIHAYELPFDDSYWVVPGLFLAGRR